MDLINEALNKAQTTTLLFIIAILLAIIAVRLSVKK